MPRISAPLLGVALSSVMGCAAGSSSTSSAPSAAVDPPHLPEQICPAQSPINISTQGVDGSPMHHVALHYATAKETIANLGHTLQVSFEPGSTVEFDGKVFEFRQFHFHTPSEHTVDGTPREMEMHMVHTLRGDDQTYLVIGVFFQEGESNGFLDQFIDELPQTEGQKVVEPAGFVDITHLLAPDERYFHYQGSLTTPPYTESVTWLVSETPRHATADQIEVFHSLEGENARAVQARNGRVVDEV